MTDLATQPNITHPGGPGIKQPPATAQGAIDAFNADQADAAMHIVARLKIDSLRIVGAAIGAHPYVHETAKGYRERIAPLACLLTKTARTQRAKERVLFTGLATLAAEYARITAHRDRAVSLGVTDPASSAFITFHQGEEIRIDERVPALLREFEDLLATPGAAEQVERVRRESGAIFDALAEQS